MSRGRGAGSNGNNHRKRVAVSLREQIAIAHVERDKALAQNRSLAATLESAQNKIADLERRLG